MYKTPFLIVLFITAALKFCNAQISDSLYKALPDSLRPKSKVALIDVERIRILNNTSKSFKIHFQNDFKSLTLQLEKNIEDVKNRIEKVPYADAIASFYLTIDAREKYAFWDKKLVAFGEGQESYRLLICNAYSNLAVYYSGSNKNNQDSAMAMLHEALNIANMGKDTENLHSLVYIGYIQIYSKLSLYHKALLYADNFFNSYSSEKEWDDTYTEIFLAKITLYGNLYRAEKKIGYADTARLLIKQLMTAKKSQASFYYFQCYYSLGFLAYCQQDYLSAIVYFDSSLSQKYRAAQGYRFYLAETYKGLSLLLTGHQELIKSLTSVVLPQKDYYTNRELNSVVYGFYNKHGDYKKALMFYTKYRAYSDSIDLIGQRGKVFESEQKYSVAQKEVDIAVLQNKNLQAQVTRNRIITVGLVLVLLLATAFYLRNKQQRHQKELALVKQRKTISTNMHDEVSGSLAALRFLVTDFKKRAKHPETKAMLDDIEEEAKHVYLQSRDFMHLLNEGEVRENHNVVRLLQMLALRFNEDSNLHVIVDADEEAIDKYFNPAQHAELYRIIKEAVANTMKHSCANEIHIILKKQGNWFCFEIKDNGNGISGGYDKDGLGLQSIKKRMAGLKGHLAIASSHLGTTLTSSFPVNKI